MKRQNWVAVVSLVLVLLGWAYGVGVVSAQVKDDSTAIEKNTTAIIEMKVRMATIGAEVAHVKETTDETRLDVKELLAK